MVGDCLSLSVTLSSDILLCPFSEYLSSSISKESQNLGQIVMKHFLTLRLELFQAGVKIPRHCRDD